MQCSQHMQKERAAELLREVQGGLRSGLCATPCEHAYRGLGPRCRELRRSCGGRAAEKGQIDQGARAQRPLSSSIGSLSPLTIRSSFLTSPPALKKGALNGCALRGACLPQQRRVRRSDCLPSRGPRGAAAQRRRAGLLSRHARWTTRRHGMAPGAARTRHQVGRAGLGAPAACGRPAAPQHANGARRAVPAAARRRPVSEL